MPTHNSTDPCNSDLSLAVDTGSSDLWVHVPNQLVTTSETDVIVNLSYGIGSASGQVVYGPALLGDFSVLEQGNSFLLLSKPIVR